VLRQGCEVREIQRLAFYVRESAAREVKYIVQIDSLGINMRLEL